jgi:hypothetical protein
VISPRPWWQQLLREEVLSNVIQEQNARELRPAATFKRALAILNLRLKTLRLLSLSIQRSERA